MPGDNIDFSAARFATYAMMPTRDDEVNALWARKIAWNTARAIGNWSTVVLSAAVSAQAGSTLIDISGLGFNTFPGIDIFHMRGGSYAFQLGWYRDGPTAGDTPVGLELRILGGTQLAITHWADGAGVLSENFSQGKHGTFVYRLRGW